MKLDLSVICRVNDPDDRIVDTVRSVASRVAEVWVLDPHSVTAGTDLAPARRVPAAEGAPSATSLEAVALAGCGSGWILWLEPDEIVTPELLDRITRLGQERTLERMGAYRVTVRTRVASRVLGSGGSGPRSRLRLFRRDGSRFAPRPGAEGIAPPAGAPLGRLREAIEERPFHGFDAYLRRADRELHREFAASWPPPRTLHLLTIWPATFVRHWIAERGFRDGKAGALWAGARATASFLRAMRIWVRAHETHGGTTHAVPDPRSD